MTKKQYTCKTLALVSILALLAISASGCALGIASVGADLAGPALNTLLDPVGPVQSCPDCPKGMTATDYIRQQEEMKKKAQNEAIRQYYPEKEQPAKDSNKEQNQQTQQTNQQ